MTNTIIKILTALAAIAGVVYIVATYGEEIVAWCRKVLNLLPKCHCCEADADDSDIEVEITVEEPTAESVAEEVISKEVAPEEAPAVEEAPVADESEPVAEEADFAE